MKKIISSILLICIMMAVFRGTAAEAADKRLYMPLWSKDDPVVYKTVYRTGDDVLISGTDISDCTGYDYFVEGSTAMFTRGAKSVVIDLKSRSVQTFKNVSKFKISEIKKNNDEYYYPLSELLPWLNAYCTVKDGTLMVGVDAASIWDYMDDFNPKDFYFDFFAECADADVDPKWIKAGSYVKSKGLDVIFDFIPVYWGVSYGEYKDYYDLFDDMFIDKNSSVYALKELSDGSEKLNTVFDLIRELGEYDELPDEIQIFGAGVKAASNISDVLDFIVYFDTFKNDNEDKMQIIDSMILNRGSINYSDAAMMAAMDIQDTYTEKWKGFEIKFRQFLLEDAAKSISLKQPLEQGIKIVSDVIGLLETSADQDLNRISKYSALQGYGHNVFLQNKDMANIWSIRNMRSHILLYIYCAEQNYKAMQGYFKDIGNIEKADSYNEIIEECRQWYGRFLSTSNAEMNDSINWGIVKEDTDPMKSIKGVLKQEYTKKIKELIPRISFISDLDTIVKIDEAQFCLMDYARAVWGLMLEEPEEYQPTVYLGDTDEDGVQELLIPQIGFCVGRISAGENGLDIRFDGHGGAAGSVYLRYNRKKDAYAIVYNYATAGYVEDRWKSIRGLSWEGDTLISAGYAEFSDVYDEPSYEEKYYVNSIENEISGEIFRQLVNGYEQLVPEDDDSGLILNYMVPCSEGQIPGILNAYAEYSKIQDGFVGWQKAQLTGDGPLGAIYVFSGCCNDIINSKAYLSDDYYSRDDSQEIYLFPNAYRNEPVNRPCIIAAEPCDGGIVFKTIGLNIALDPDFFDFSDQILTLSDDSVEYRYRYNPIENSFESGLLTLLD